MKRIFTLSILLISLINFCTAQADLVVSAAGYDPTVINKGEIFLVQAEVTNLGNSTAGANYLFIYFSQDLNVSNDEIISRVSVKELGPGESQLVNFLYPIPSPLSTGAYYIGFEVDPYDNVAESNEDNLFCAPNANGNCGTFNITSSLKAYQKFNYPILFIHGWTGSSDTWEDFADEAALYYGWTYGGRLDYCLNPDDNQSTSDGYFHDYADVGALNTGDFFYVNYDVATDGQPFVGNDGIPFNDDYSNQSAIVKQGWALSDAVGKVLQVTGAENVILVGHSMGGLAAREYLQNEDNWQPDGAHHVAKLLTIGTPNGGSNVSGGNLGIFVGLDESSEAVRDLRHTGSPFTYGAQYLYGGNESTFSIFYNDDVDCNGFVGDLITGLNEKTFPNDVNYSCVVGIGNNLPSLSGDGVVAEIRADLNNYLLAQPPLSNLHADRFDVTSSHLSIHQANHDILIRGLDEPNFYETAYAVPLNSFNYSYVTEQSPNSTLGDGIDWDDYKVEITQTGLLEVNLFNLPVNVSALFLLNENLDELQAAQSFGESNIGLEYIVGPGIYYIEVGSIPTPNSWRFPYAYSIHFTEIIAAPVAKFTSNVQSGCAPLTVNFTNQSENAPDTYSWSFEGGSPATSTFENPTVVYSQPGVYQVSLTVSNSSGTDTHTETNYITIDTSPIAGFSFDTPQGNVVSFTNETVFSMEAPNYSWDFGDGQTSTETSPVHTYQNDGNYIVVLTAENSCGVSTSSSIVEIMTVGTAELLGSSSVSISPNPTSKDFTLSIEGSHLGSYQVALFNNLGQLVEEQKQLKSGTLSKFYFKVVELPAGTYFIKIKSDEGQLARKLVVE